MKWKYTNQQAPRTQEQLQQYRMVLDELTVHDVSNILHYIHSRCVVYIYMLILLWESGCMDALWA